MTHRVTIELQDDGQWHLEASDGWTAQLIPVKGSSYYQLQVVDRYGADVVEMGHHTLQEVVGIACTILMQPEEESAV